MAFLTADMSRARELALKLYTAFSISGQGIFGETRMPEDEPPGGVQQGSLEHLLFVTLTVTIDYQRDALELWRISREAYADPEARYLFSPASVYEAGLPKVARDMQRVRLSRKPRRDPRWWHAVAVTFLKKWGGDPRNFLADCGYHAPTVLRRLRSDTHLMRGRRVPDYPYLRGSKISCLWIRMLRDNLGIELSELEAVPIPVDVHVLRATLCSGVLKGPYRGPIDAAYEDVRAVWREAARGVQLPGSGRMMIALDVDQPLWHLSRSGCSGRGNGELGPCPRDCPAAPGCATGCIAISPGYCEVDT